ncbi:MAG TPA: TonB-dependent receptor, partial [Gemmatimonadales bacterium]|nr:TonB-dependent receptor [Gemmatimonadales bacterium]
NFTYFLDDADQGDEFNQREERTVVGLNARHAQELRALGRAHQLTVGLQTRADVIEGLGLYRTVDRARTGTVRRDDVTQWGTGLVASLQTTWTPRLRSTVGLRGDAYLFDVTSDLAANSGRRSAGIVSPKASLAYAPSPAVELYLGGGFGFHSNDARGTTITVDPVTGDPAAPVDPLVRSRGAEAGVRATPLAGWRSTLTVWALELDSELLFVGDGGITEPSFRSRRRGITWTNDYRPIPLLAFDLDISLARARFTGVPADETHVPGALENVVSAGVTWQSPVRGLVGAVRVRHLGSYALVETNAARATPTTLLNAEVGCTLAGVRLQVGVLNVLDRRASDIQYYYASRLPGEAPGGVEDVHFHPVEPRQLRVTLGWGL